MGSDQTLPEAVEGEGAAARLFTAALLTGNYVAARSVLHAALGDGLGHIYERIVVPALEEVGILWYENRITVADEHLASAVAQTAVASLYPLIRWPAGGPRAVVGCADPELHTFGARMLADVLALDGWQTTFMGGRISTLGGLADLRLREMRLIAVSITLEAHMPSAQALIHRVREQAPGAKVLAGGRAVAALPDAAQLLGADAVVASLSTAVRLARTWR
ncbi:cobalamin B12-binding domain-containing protein [Sorangium sp. So ce1153]|uniref:cobalamin B12-binding domain-containing protein n=1 Tax=Sorangium sp. So ce1153 TaxID=3133333 RepID=UPI003F64594E